MKFRILFITQDDPFYVKLFFEEFFRNYKDLDEIRGVVIAQAMGKKSLFALANQMYNFYGPFNFIKVGSKYAIYKLLPIFNGFLNGAIAYNLNQLCKKYKIKVLKRQNINSEAFLDELKTMNLDLIISVAAPAIFKDRLIQIPRYGCINIHNAKLPKYRGMMPNFWQLYHNEKKVGITIHEINPKIDDGKILLQKEVEVEPAETLDFLIKRTKRVGAYCMMEAIDMIKSGKIKYIENDAKEASYFSFPTSKDVRKFRDMGHRLL